MYNVVTLKSHLKTNDFLLLEKEVLQVQVDVAFAEHKMCQEKLTGLKKLKKK